MVEAQPTESTDARQPSSMTFDKRLEKVLDKMLRCFVRCNIDGTPALYRWWLSPVPFTGKNVVIHEFIADDDLEPHLHPRGLISIGLRGQYVEIVTLDGVETEQTLRAPWFRIVPAGILHRVRLIDSKPCWTLAIK